MVCVVKMTVVLVKENKKILVIYQRLGNRN